MTHFDNHLLIIYDTFASQHIMLFSDNFITFFLIEILWEAKSFIFIQENEERFESFTYVIF